jgi:tetratricopeptide (TPR) repeat protein
MDFAPNHSWVKQLANDISFNKYEVLYKQKSENLFANDTIFTEKTMYLQKDNEQSFQQLINCLEKESRWIDLISMYVYKLKISPSDEIYTPLIRLVEQHFNENEIVYILEDLSYHSPAFFPLQQDLFNKYVKANKINKIFEMMNNYDFKLSDAQVQTIGTMIQEYEQDLNSLHPDTLKTFIRPVIKLFPLKTESLLNKCVISLLKTHELTYIQIWLKSFKENHENLKIFEKIDTMEKLSNDLDQMQMLGELYYEFRQLEKAIECFSWEMELMPTNPKPLQWLSKIYREMGMNLESDAYQQLCINLQKRA